MREVPGGSEEEIRLRDAVDPVVLADEAGLLHGNDYFHPAQGQMFNSQKANSSSLPRQNYPSGLE